MAGLTRRRHRALLYRLASRNLNTNSNNSNFNVREMSPEGDVNSNNLYNSNSDGNENSNSGPTGVRPVASIFLGYSNQGSI